MPDQPANPPKRRRLRWWHLALLIMLACAGWWWLSRPPEMRLVQVIPLPDDPLRQAFDQPSPPLPSLNLQSKPAPGMMIVMGANNRPCWRVKLPILRGIKPEDRDSADEQQLGEFNLSPDGHVLALARLYADEPHEGQQMVHVWSWRDGKALGEVHFPWLSSAFTTRPWVNAVNDGRIWICDPQDSPPNIFKDSVHLWAIDGTHIAQGQYTSTITSDCWPSVNFSPDGTALLISEGPAWTPIDYTTVRVRGEKVLFTHIGTAAITQRVRWCNPNALLDDWGTRVGPNGVITRAHARKPAVGQNQYPRVTLETNLFRRSHLMALLHRLPFADKLDLLPDRPRLACYTAPGRLRAVLPLDNCQLPQLGSTMALHWHGDDFSVVDDNFTLSPDGRQVSFEGETYIGKRARFVYGW